MAEQEFMDLGFILKKDITGIEVFDENGQPIYVKSFIKRHNQAVSFCYIEGSQNPETQEYSLSLSNLAHLKAWRAEEGTTKEMVASFGEDKERKHLEDLVGSYKKEKGIPESVNVGVQARYKHTGLSIKGKDLESMYSDFEQALIALEFIDESIRENPSHITYSLFG